MITLKSLQKPRQENKALLLFDIAIIVWGTMLAALIFYLAPYLLGVMPDLAPSQAAAQTSGFPWGVDVGLTALATLTLISLQVAFLIAQDLRKNASTSVFAYLKKRTAWGWIRFSVFATMFVIWNAFLILMLESVPKEIESMTLSMNGKAAIATTLAKHVPQAWIDQTQQFSDQEQKSYCGIADALADQNKTSDLARPEPSQLISLVIDQVAYDNLFTKGCLTPTQWRLEREKITQGAQAALTNNPTLALHAFWSAWPIMKQLHQADQAIAQKTVLTPRKACWRFSQRANPAINHQDEPNHCQSLDDNRALTDQEWQTFLQQD